VNVTLHIVAALLGRDALRQIVGVARDALRPRAELVAENALLRQQLLVLRRQVARPRLTRRDRWWMVAAARVTKTWCRRPRRSGEIRRVLVHSEGGQVGSVLSA
jgi:hypothetical protein